MKKLKDYRSQINGAESQEDFAERIKEAFMKIVSGSDYSSVGIITHGMPFWVIFGYFLNDNRVINVGNCAYSVLSKEDQKFALDYSDGIEYKID